MQLVNVCEREQIYDILPSFQLHDHLYHRRVVEKNETTNPPTYEENFLLASPNQRANLRSSSPIEAPKLLDCIDTLQQVNKSIESVIKLKYPTKVYSPGEIISGYVHLENNGNTIIPIEQIVVSLECDVGIFSHKYNKAITKTIINMIDLEASIVPPYQHLSETLLYPKAFMKQFFQFRIPKYLLDNCCERQLTEHMKVPPSFGCKHINISGKKIDEVKDYAKLGDYVSYTIKAKFIGKAPPNYTNKAHKSDFVLLAGVFHDFKVGTHLTFSDHIPYGTTNEQLFNLEKYVRESIEELKEKKMLFDVGIKEEHDQIDIIYSSVGKHKCQTNCDLQVPKKSQEVTTRVRKPLFGTVLGNIKATADISEYVTIQKPEITAVDIHANYKLPVEFNSSFISLGKEKIVSQFDKFKRLQAEVIKLSQEGLDIHPRLFKLLDSLTQFEYSETKLPNLFKRKTLNLVWNYDSSKKSLQCNVRMPLEFNFKEIFNKKITLVPGFQHCLFGRMYKLELHFTTKHGRLKPMALPITVI
ncbi:hypothetical protein JL09_g4578 [Pichia kudriavzevii]|uniref:Bul1 N-terminal domain-containing protein n=1 Tax=Pichia kudriavzevii TaxID=4909 RepID=A0A099NUI2_PICKU|nr:hypothetical protein JL09_g4578 [Pichia kudriavzevii]